MTNAKPDSSMDHPSLPFRGVVAQIIGEINAGILGLVKPF